MWERIWGFIPSGMILTNAILAAVIPYFIYKMNQKLHEYGDPPWKKESNE